MSAALFLRAPAERVAATLETLLLPDSGAVVTPMGDGWVSVHAEQLSEDLADLEELSAPLSAEFGEVWAVATLLHHFVAGAHATSAHEAGVGVPFTLDGGATAQEGPPIHVFREAEKPGLAEFFGRSTDE